MGISNSKKTACEQNQCDPSISSNIPPRRCLSLTEERTEPFSLIWLDEYAQENSLDSLRTQTLFREITNDNCFFFDRSDIFLFEIEKMKMEHKKILIIMSGSLAKQVLPNLHDVITTIIIFCGDYNRYVNLLDKYRDVVEICTTHEKLKSSIKNELKSFKFKLFENQIVKSTRPLNSTNGVENNSAYYSYISCIELLKQMPQTKQAKDIMLKKCEDYYRGDQSQKKYIELFRDTYTSNQAINWYVLDCFVFRLVNRAFRTEDITLWYVFRYYVADLCKQLEDIHKEQNIQTPLTLYRGQPRMLTSELEYFESNIDCLVSTNGFLSSSYDIQTAQVFNTGAEDTDDFKVVMFEITVDGASLQNTVFVDIDKYMKRSYENEILFNIGSVFKIKSVTHDSNLGVWMIKMNATDEGTHEIKKNLEEKKREFRKDNINLMFGRLLIDMDEYPKAESYFQMLLQELPRSHKDLALVYDYIGDLNMKSTNWKDAFMNFNLAYEIKKKTLPSNHSLIGVTLNNIGNYYKIIGDYIQAFQYYTKALQCKNNQSNMARIQLNIGAIHGKNGDYDKAISLCTEARDTLHQIHPRPYNEIIYGQGILGQIYSIKKEYNIAADYYLTALEMSEKFLSIGNRLRINCVKALVELYNQQGMKQMAIDFCRNKLLLYEKCLPERHISIAHLLMKLGELYEDNHVEKIDSLQRALRILEKSVHLEYATIANCLMMIGECYKKQNGYQSAFRYYIRALEIQKKIYPKDHSIVLQTQSIIDSGESQT